MSNFGIFAESLIILPHPNADLLELAQVGLFRAVVGKGQYQTGDYALYIPEQALVPEELLIEMNLSGKLAGSLHNRVKAIRLRGELSQGIVCTPKAVVGLDLAQSAADGFDFAEMLGITKWIPEIPANMGGEVFAAPRILHWVEIDNVKAHPDLFVPGEPVQASEKAHGTCCVCSVDLSASDPSEAFLVSSKGLGGHNLGLVENPDNLYWRALRQHEVEAKARALISLLEDQRTTDAPYQIMRLGIFGEVYGAGVQDLTYGINSRNTPGYAVFDIYVESAQESSYWLDQDEVRELCARVGLPMVPTLYEGPYDYETLAALAEGETVLGEGRHLREGLVVRPAHERYAPELGTRLILKFINPDYLTRKDGTEFE